MRTVYLGTSDFAATVLDALAASPHRPDLVVTRPDARRGRGQKVAPPPVAGRAELLGIEVFQPEDVNAAEARERIAAAKPEAVLICAFGALIQEPLLSDHELLNVHPSLLPRWRGAAPVERAIEAGDEETGVTIMRPTAELDAGPIALQRAEAIRADDDYGSLSERLAALGGELLVEALDLSPAFREQSDTGVTYAEKIGPDDRLLESALTADLLERRVRALRPHVGAYLELPWDERLGVTRAALPQGSAVARDDAAAGDEAGDGPGGGPPPGQLAIAGERLLYGTASGPLELLEVHPAGKRPMDAKSWIRGYGERLNG
jgi:methionyl-tRNA formyltransferase